MSIAKGRRVPVACSVGMLLAARFGESLAAASHVVGWTDLVISDPLGRADPVKYLAP